MARHGESKHFKRSVVTDLAVIPRKKYKYYIRQYPGKHDVKHSMPLRGFIRDIMKIANNSKEARYLIKGGFVKVDGKTITEEKYSVGFNDVIQIKNSYFIAGFGSNGKISASESSEPVNSKHLKSMSKRYIKGGKTILSLHDGTNILDPAGKVQAGDTIVMSLKDRKIEKIIPFEQGREVMIFSGKNAGKKGKISKIDGDTAIIDVDGTGISAKSDACIPL